MTQFTALKGLKSCSGAQNTSNTSQVEKFQKGFQRNELGAGHSSNKHFLLGERHCAGLWGEGSE